MRPIIAVLSCLAVFASSTAAAQVAGDGERADVLPSRWSVGLAAGLRTGLYAGEDRHSRVLPFAGYEGERFYWRGIDLGYHLVKTERFVLDGFIAGRLDAMDADDFGARELARRGIDRRQLEDRDDSADAGVAASWRGAAGELKLDLRADITDTSGGYEADLSYRYPTQAGGFLLTPRIGLLAQSADLADYYYGTLDEEIARGVVRYRPGSSVTAYIGLTLARRFGPHWRAMADLGYQRLPDEIRDSPLVDGGSQGVGRLFLGVVRSF